MLDQGRLRLGGVEQLVAVFLCWRLLCHRHIERHLILIRRVIGACEGPLRTGRPHLSRITDVPLILAVMELARRRVPTQD